MDKARRIEKVENKAVLILACTCTIANLQAKVKSFQDNWRSFDDHRIYVEYCLKLEDMQKAFDALITACTPMFEFP